MRSPLATLLDRHHYQLIDVARRQFVMEALTKELDRVTRGETFRIANDVTWLMLLDSRDVLVIHLASWAKGVYTPGGLIGQLRADYLRRFPKQRPPEERDDSYGWRTRRDREHADSFGRLFPNITGDHPDGAAFEGLTDGFATRMKPVVDDRHENRAHPYEGKGAGTAKMLDVSELRALIDYGDQFLNDLRMVGDGSPLHHDEMNSPKAGDVAPDLVDSLILGTSDRIARVRKDQDRDAYYAQLHAEHDRLPPEPHRYFNDRLFSRMLDTPSAGGVGRKTGAAGDAEGATMTTKSRYFSFFPALPLAKNIELGEWIAGSPPDGVAWASDRFRRLSTALVGSFEKRHFKGGAMLWHRDRGFDGTKPTDEEIAAIRAAVTFAVLDANDRISDDGNKGWHLATTENADVFIQPIDEDGGIAHSRGGSLKQVLVGGLTIGGEPPPLADAVQSIMNPVRVSSTLAAAIYTAALSKAGSGASVAIAADWHRGALMNASAMTIEHRLIALKTGFEALTHEDNSRECAKLLRALFENTTAGHQQHLPWIGVLWSPKERTDLQRPYVNPAGKPKVDVRSELEDWFMALAEARNDIIHGGTLKRGDYPAPPERPLSRYAGTLFWIGERVLREAIKAQLGVNVLLCGPIRRHAKITAALQAPGPAEPSPPPPQMDPEEVALIARIKAEPQPPDRDLAALLGAMGCGAANQVVLSKARPQPSASPQANLESSIRLMDKWTATVGGRSMLLSKAEHDTLQAAGAEDKLPDLWWSCP